MIPKNILLFLIVFGCASAIFAEERVRLDQLVGELLKSNPDLQAATLRYQAALTRPSREGALPDPRVQFGWVSSGSIVPGKGLGEDPNANIGFQISQEFPYPGKRGSRTDVALKEAAAEKQMYRATVQSKVASLSSAFYELNFVYEAIELLEENKNLLTQLAKVAEVRYSVGNASQQDLIRSSIEISILENRLLSQEQKKRSLVAEINSLLNREPLSPLGRPEKVDAPQLEPLEILQKRMKEVSPMLLSQHSRVETREAQFRLAEREKYPDFDLMGGYYNQGEMDDMWEVQFSMNLPIWTGRKQGRAAQEASLMLSEAKQTYRATEQTLLYQLQDAYAKAETAQKLSELYSIQVVPQSRIALESSIASYETGAVDFLTVLSNFMTILEYRMNYFEQQAAYLKAYASLRELTIPEVQS